MMARHEWTVAAQTIRQIARSRKLQTSPWADELVAQQQGCQRHGAKVKPVFDAQHAAPDWSH